MKTLGVMQPYLFPYLGYYQLVMAVDKFVFYDDVTFIKGGYINRNNILANGKAQRFTVAVPGSSSNIKIRDLNFDVNVKKVLRSIEQSYNKAPYFQDVYQLIEETLQDKNRNVAHICSNSIKKVFEYLETEKEFYNSSDIGYDRSMSAADKLIAMSHIFDTQQYINTPGGRDLYDRTYFSNYGITLSFIEMRSCIYDQPTSEFISHLSMIDVLMWNSKKDVRQLLTKYEIV